MARQFEYFGPLRNLVVAAGLALSLAGCIGYEDQVQRGYVVDEKLLGQIKTGTAAEQVLNIMGTPSTTSTVGGDAWYYISQKLEQKLEFMREHHESQGEKVVFDFISRTTPTAGADQSFVRNLMKNLLRF